jgi:hypothetical protein
MNHKPPPQYFLLLLLLERSSVPDVELSLPSHLGEGGAGSGEVHVAHEVVEAFQPDGFAVALLVEEA